MRIKLDENLPAALVGILAAAGHDVDSVPSEGLDGQQDPVVWRAAEPSRSRLIERVRHLFATESVAT